MLTHSSEEEYPPVAHSTSQSLNSSTQKRHARNSLPRAVRRETELDGLEALRQAASRAALRELKRDLTRSKVTTRGSEEVTSSNQVEVLSEHAAPLSPLRERDLAALSDLFQRQDIYHIEADIAQSLLMLWPEPCWEDNPFEFLKEFL